MKGALSLQPLLLEGHKRVHMYYIYIHHLLFIFQYPSRNLFTLSEPSS